MSPAWKMIWKTRGGLNRPVRQKRFCSGHSMLVSALTAKLMDYRGRQVERESDHRNGRQNLES